MHAGRLMTLAALAAHGKRCAVKRLIVAVLLATSGPAVAATIVPLQTGTYVLSGTPCRDAPFAAMMRYDGKGLSDPHSAQCRSRILIPVPTSSDSLGVSNGSKW